MKRAAQLVFGYIIALLLVLLYFAPALPKTKSGWVAFLVFGPLLCVLGEWVGDNVSAPWGESYPLLKFLKAASVILVALLSMFVLVLLTG